ISEGGTGVPAIGITDPDSSSFTYTASGVTHGTFQTSTDGTNWRSEERRVRERLAVNEVGVQHERREAAPAWSLTADDGAGVNHTSNTLAGSVTFTNVNDAPTLNSVSLTISEGGTGAPVIGITDPDSSAFTYTASGVTHGTFQTSTDGTNW